MIDSNITMAELSHQKVEGPIVPIEFVKFLLIFNFRLKLTLLTTLAPASI